MGINYSNDKQKGFTVVEILVVIIVLGILLSIVLVVYPGYQARTRDSERKSDVSQLAAAFGAYVLQKNNYMTIGSGCGYKGNGNGWISQEPPTTDYPKSIATCLKEAGVISNATDFVDPSGCKGAGGSCTVPVKAYLKATCLTGGQPATYIMAYLETQPANNAAMDALCDTGSVSDFDSNAQKWGTTYGLNYYVRAK